MKTCTKCSKEKELVEFYKKPLSKDGFHSICIDCIKISQAIYYKKWYQENKQSKRSSNAAWFSDNPSKLNEYQKKYFQSHQDKWRLKGHRRRALKLGGGVYSITIEEVKSMMKRPCFYCGEESKHIDHIVPLSRGGRHSIGNLIQACASCNLSKSNKFIIEWRSINYGIRR
jgi:5-methylcytosine-specific restriction endonuclease McrA